jgi:cell division septal protein FtsQ
MQSFKNKKPRKKYLDPGTIVLIRQIVLGLIIFSAVAALITSVWYGTRIEALTIKDIKVSGGITIQKESVRLKAEEQLAGDYFHLVPKRFSWFYPEAEILGSVSQVERIKDVKVDKTSNTEVSITFDEYLPDSLWCELEQKEKCYFLDEKGYSFTVAPNLIGGSLLRFYHSEMKPEAKKSPFSEQDYVQAKEFTKLLTSIGWLVSKVEINSTRDAFYDLADGGEIKTTLTEEITAPFSNLETILTSEEFKHLKPGNFKYIDLRFGTRVFVNEVLEAEEVIASSTEEVVKKSEEAEPEAEQPLFAPIITEATTTEAVDVLD